MNFGNQNELILGLDDITEEDLKDPEFVKQLEWELKKRACELSFYEFLKQSWLEVSTQDYIDNWHVEFICNVLQLVSEGKIKKLLINIPPGFAKTHTVGVAFLAWDWINHPERYSIYTTYALPLSTKAAKDHRNLIKSDWFQERWGEGTAHNIFIDRDSASKKQEFENNHKGGRFSTGKGGEVTGRRGNFLIFDDLNKAQDASGKAAILASEIQKGVEFLAETLWSRRILTNIEEKKSAIVGIGQRLHHADVSQWCIDQGDFVHINLPMECEWDERCIILKVIDEDGNEKYLSALGDDEADKIKEQYEQWEIFAEDPREEGEYLFPEIFGDEEVADAKTSLGPVKYSAQYQQKPTPTEGAALDPSWFGRYSLKDMRKTLEDSYGKLIISVDGTFTESTTSDYVVCQVWKEYNQPKTGPNPPPSEYYLLDQWRGKAGLHETIKRIIALHLKWFGPKHIVVERAANGYATIETLEKMLYGQGGIKVVGFNPRTSKEGRVEAISPIVHSSRVFFPEDGEIDLSSLDKELAHFPYGKNDDQVDALSQAILYFTQGDALRSADKLRRLVSNWKMFY